MIHEHGAFATGNGPVLHILSSKLMLYSHCLGFYWMASLCPSVPSGTPCYTWSSRLLGLRLAVTVSQLSLFAVTSTVSRSADWVFCRRSLGWYLMLFSCVASDYGAGGADHRGLPFAILTISGQPRPQAKVVFVGFLHCEVTLFPLFLYCPLWKEVTIPSPYLRGGEL